MKSKNIRATALIVFLITLSMLGSCASIPTEKMANYVKFNIVEADEPTPVVFFFQHSGGRSDSAGQWVKAFEKLGVSSVLIDSAGVRGMRDLLTVDYGSDLKPALELAKSNPQLDLSRYGLMGFSKGGTAALTSESSLDSDDPLPSFVFALYPGAIGNCPNKYRSAETAVHIFYGEKDGWGLYKNTIGACKRTAAKNNNTTYHTMGDVHHGFEGFGDAEYSCCGGVTYKVKGDSEAREKIRKLIDGIVKNTWVLSEDDDDD